MKGESENSQEEQNPETEEVVSEATVEDQRKTNESDAGTTESQSEADTEKEEPKEKSDSDKSPEELMKEIQAERERALRIQAEMANFRKRQEKDRLTWRTSLLKEIVEPMLEPLDNMKLALNASQGGEEDSSEQAAARLKSLSDGVRMVHAQILEIFSSKGIESIHPHGEAFDHNLHNAIGRVECGDVPEGHVCNVLRDGFTVNGQILRPAMVQIASKPAEDEETDEPPKEDS